MVGAAAETKRFRAWRPEIDEYLQAYRDGYFDAGCHCQIIASVADVHAPPDRGGLDLVVGAFDVADFCFRRGLRGVWAYYPIEGEYVLVAPDLRALISGLLDGSITL